MKEWETKWNKRNACEKGGERESISQDEGLSDFGAAFSKSIIEKHSLNLPPQQNSIPSLLLNPPSSSSDSSSSSSDLEVVPEAPDPHSNHLPSSITHAIHSEVRKIYDYPEKKATSYDVDPQQGFVEVEVKIEEGGKKHMHWHEQENQGEEEQVEKQRNLEDEMDEEENDNHLSKEEGHAKIRSLLYRIGDKHGDEEEEGEMVEMGEKIEEVGDHIEKSVTTTIRGVVEMGEGEEDEGGSEQRQELEDQFRQTLANPDLLQQLCNNSSMRLLR